MVGISEGFSEGFFFYLGVAFFFEVFLFWSEVGCGFFCSGFCSRLVFRFFYLFVGSLGF